MKALRFAIATLCVLAAAGCQTVDRAALPARTTVVVGTGDASKDVRAVQAALDLGGTITLRGTFNFGNSGQLHIRREVRLVIDDARIQGGHWVFISQ